VLNILGIILTGSLLSHMRMGPYMSSIYSGGPLDKSASTLDGRTFSLDGVGGRDDTNRHGASGTRASRPLHRSINFGRIVHCAINIAWDTMTHTCFDALEKLIPAYPVAGWLVLPIAFLTPSLHQRPSALSSRIALDPTCHHQSLAVGAKATSCIVREGRDDGVGQVLQNGRLARRVLWLKVEVETGLGTSLFAFRPSYCTAVHFCPAQKYKQMVEHKYKNVLEVSTGMHFEEVRRDLGK
jgi:hypothetical protein